MQRLRSEMERRSGAMWQKTDNGRSSVVGCGTGAETQGEEKGGKIMTVLTQSVVKTRKTHCCYGCNHPFPNGSTLLSSAIAWEGKMYTTYLCQDCYYESINWSNHEWESIFPGDIGYKKNGVWYSHHS